MFRLIMRFAPQATQAAFAQLDPAQSVAASVIFVMAASGRSGPLPMAQFRLLRRRHCTLRKNQNRPHRQSDTGAVVLKPIPRALVALALTARTRALWFALTLALGLLLCSFVFAAHSNLILASLHPTACQ
ncbi:MAG: hypothetical protein Q8L76_09085 [Cypionkella sp.]|nr:hypothetical protein [Cypionkella sp.]